MLPAVAVTRQLFFVAVVALCTTAHAAPLNLEDLLPRQSIDADVMDVRPPKDAAHLMAKLQASMKKNPAWLMEYVKKHGNSGGPLPYHENFGMTPKEYERTLEAMKQLRPVKVAQIRLKVDHRPPATIRLLPHRGAKNFPETSIDLKARVLTIESWRLEKPRRFSAPGGPFEGAQGYEWELRKGMEMERVPQGLLVRFAVARLRDGRCMMTYEIKDVVDGKMKDKRRFIFTYACPSRKPKSGSKR
jgi:hypothetical protein